jgi:hypothetical protein
MVGAPHAAGAAIDFHGQTRRHAPAPVIALVNREVDAEAGAARAAGQAGMRRSGHQAVAGVRWMKTGAQV